jgi:hypothetical protein
MLVAGVDIMEMLLVETRKLAHHHFEISVVILGPAGASFTFISLALGTTILPCT